MKAKKEDRITRRKKTESANQNSCKRNSLYVTFVRDLEVACDTMENGRHVGKYKSTFLKLSKFFK